MEWFVLMRGGPETNINTNTEPHIMVTSININTNTNAALFQMRGGPEPLMVTGWAQIVSLDPSYRCNLQRRDWFINLNCKWEQIINFWLVSSALNLLGWFDLDWRCYEATPCLHLFAGSTSKYVKTGQLCGCNHFPDITNPESYFAIFSLGHFFWKQILKALSNSAFRLRAKLGW